MKCNMSVIPVDGTRETKEVEFRGDEPSIHEIRKLINTVPGFDKGEHFERVNVWLGDRYTDMFVDDIGVMKGLPVNPEATKIYRANWLMQHPDANPEDLPEIYGVAVLFDQKVWF